MLAKGSKGSIPATYRKSLRLKKGDEIIFTFNNNELVLIPIKVSMRND